MIDATKEAFCVLHRDDHFGAPFRLLGVDYDAQLTMNKYCKDLARRLRNKLAMLLNTKWFLTAPELVTQFKAHVLSLLELPTPAIYHAAPTYLQRVDDVQFSFLRAVGLSESEAFVNFNMAPLQMRRDLAMLGALHKCGTGIAHPEVQAVFPPEKTLENTGSWHYFKVPNPLKHPHQLHDFKDIKKPWPLWMKRSVFGLIDVYNELDPSIVAIHKVSLFQRELQSRAKELCKNQFDEWQWVYRPKW